MSDKFPDTPSSLQLLLHLLHPGGGVVRPTGPGMRVCMVDLRSGGVYVAGGY